MALGPGKYDALATHVRIQADARAVVVVVIDGNQGSGFSVQAHAEIGHRLPSMLRYLADAIEKEYA